MVAEAFEGAPGPVLPSVFDDLARDGGAIELSGLPIIGKPNPLRALSPLGVRINFFRGSGGYFFIKGRGFVRDITCCHAISRYVT